MKNSAIQVSYYVPCLNEEENITLALETISSVGVELGISYEIIVVDDASTDDTVRKVEEFRKANPNVPIELIQNAFCRGLGFNYFIASHRARGEYFMLACGDASEPPEALRTILNRMGTADAVVPYFGEHETRSWKRRITSRAFTYLVNLLGGHNLQYYNGTVLHKTENVRMWFAETVGFGYQAELLCRLLDEGISIVEVPIANRDRSSGESKAFTLANFLSVSNTLFHIVMRRLQKYSINHYANAHRASKKQK